MAWIDLDDTLIDFRANARAALVALYDSMPRINSLFPTAAEWTEAYERHNLALWSQYNIGDITRDYLRVERFRRPLVEAGMPEGEALSLSPDLDPIYLDLLAGERRLVPGAVSLLERLRAAGITTGVLSNGFKEVQHRKIESAGLGGLIDIVVLSDDIGVNKPDVRLYRHAMERSGYTDPAVNIMVGDNPSTDIAGALAAGWEAVLFDPLHLLDAPEGAMKIHSLDEIEVC